MHSDRAIVIGAGFGGLSAAVRLRCMGHPVTLVEARDQLGGRAGVIRKQGHTFDTGPTVITAPHLFEELFTLCGHNLDDHLEMIPVDPFYRVTFPDGNHFDYVGDRERLVDEIARFNPDDIDGYRKLARHAQQIFDIGYQKLADEPFDSFFDMLRIVPEMIRLQSYRSVYALVSKYIDDERLRQVFTFQPLLVGGNPFDVSSIYLLIHRLEQKWGVHFAEGGTTALVDAIGELLDDIGVDIRLNTPVDRLEVDDDGVQAAITESGERLDCRFVVSNADPTHTYRQMIGADYLPRSTSWKISRTRQSMGLFVGFFGTDKAFPDIAHHTIALGPRYRGLLDDIFSRKVLADDFSLYLHRPTATDSSLAPEGHETFYVLSPVPNNQSGIDWDDVGDDYFDRILQHLEQRHMPGLRDSLTTSFWHGPDYFQSQLRSVHGAGFGPEPILRQSAWFRFHNRSKAIDGLYFVGAGVHPGAGIPGVLNSSKVTQKVVPRPTVDESNSPSVGDGTTKETA